MKFSLHRLTAAAVIYAGFTGWLMYPWLDHFSGTEYLFLLSLPASAVGAYLLSRRWIYSFWASVLAGFIYGFGSFSLGLLCYYPLVSVVYALVPFSILPGVFAYKLIKQSAVKLKILTFLGCLLPFALVIAAFGITAAMPFYPMPLNTPAVPQVFLALLSPTAVKADLLCPGFFHIPLAFLFIGLVVLFKSKRISPIIIFSAAVMASAYRPILNVPPVFWLSIAVLVVSVTIAAGMQAIMLAGKTDSVWLLIAGCISAIAAITSFVLAGNDSRFLCPAQLHSLGALVIMIIFFISRTKPALRAIKLVILLAGVCVDIIMTTSLLMRNVF